MPTSYSELLRIALQETGENENTWGDIANENTFEMLEQAIAKMSSIVVTTGDHVLTTNNGTTDEARCAILKLTGSPIAALTITIPASEKWYIAHNALSTAQTITFSTGTGTTTSLTQNMVGLFYCDGTNVISVVGENTLAAGKNLSDLDDAATARDNLGLGDVAVADVGSGLEISGGVLNVTLSPADTGDVIQSYRATKSGWVFLSGGTIGNASSGATLRANADTSALFTLLWGQCTNAVLPIQNSDGSAGVRGASAAADYAANKRLPVPDYRGRAPAAVDNLGGTAANRLVNAFDGTILGNSGGDERHTLVTAEIPSHRHNSGAGTRASTTGIYGSTTTDAPGSASQSLDASSSSATHQQLTSLTGGGGAHNNTQPTITVNYFIKL